MSRFISKVANQYAELWKAIIRPPRDIYSEDDFGPSTFFLEDRWYRRNDFQLMNKRGLKIMCSHFETLPESRVCDQLPCVIYLHGNSSSRLEAMACIPKLLSLNITVACLDFSGSGLSEGEFVSLGWHERDDLARLIGHLRDSGTVSCIGLWGRSMGAATALLHADRDPSIASMVLDSSFSSLRTLASELAYIHVKLKLPKFLIGSALSIIRNTVQQKAQFDIDHLVPIEHAGHTFIPAMFLAAKKDDFVPPHHSKDLYDSYGGDKKFVLVDGDHNSKRPDFILDSVAIFFYNTLQCEHLPNRKCESSSACVHNDDVSCPTSLGQQNSFGMGTGVVGYPTLDFHRNDSMSNEYMVDGYMSGCVDKDRWINMDSLELSQINHRKPTKRKSTVRSSSTHLGASEYRHDNTANNDLSKNAHISPRYVNGSLTTHRDHAALGDDEDLDEAILLAIARSLQEGLD